MAIHVVGLCNDLSDIDPNAKPDGSVRLNTCFEPKYLLLDPDCAGDSIASRRKNREEAVAGAFDHLALVLAYRWG